MRERTGWRDYLMKPSTLGSYQIKIGLYWVNPTIATKQNKVLIHPINRVFQYHRKQVKINIVLNFFHY